MLKADLARLSTPHETSAETNAPGVGSISGSRMANAGRGFPPLESVPGLTAPILQQNPPGHPPAHTGRHLANAVCAAGCGVKRLAGAMLAQDRCMRIAANDHYFVNMVMTGLSLAFMRITSVLEALSVAFRP